MLNELPTVIMMYECPDCKGLFREGVIHQHKDGEWVNTANLKMWYQMRR